MHGLGFYSFASGEQYFGEWNLGKRDGPGLTIWVNGATRFGIWNNGTEPKVGLSNVHSVFPELKSTFYELDTEGRKHIQSALKNAGYYRSEVDGLWGRHTLSALVWYASRNLGTIYLNNPRTAQQLLISIISSPNSGGPNNPESKITNDGILRPISSGTGFFVSRTGHIVTNNHVIDKCAQVRVYIGENELTSEIVATDTVNDLALLKVNFLPESVFPLDPDGPKLLQDVFVAGYPFGAALSTSVKVTKGIVSSMTGVGNNYTNIQIDAALQPGNSGGPIISEFGNVVAVAVAKLDLMTSLEKFGAIPENTNFGIKAFAVRNLLEGNGVQMVKPNSRVTSSDELGRAIADGTLFLSCWAN